MMICQLKVTTEDLMNNERGRFGKRGFVQDILCGLDVPPTDEIHIARWKSAFFSNRSSDCGVKWIRGKKLVACVMVDVDCVFDFDLPSETARGSFDLSLAQASNEIRKLSIIEGLQSLFESV